MQRIILVAAWILLALPVASGQVAPPEQQSSVQAYARLSFTESPAPAHRLTNSELLESAEMFSAYTQGAAVLPRYHDPVETRGSKGVALFRSAAPAVTLVVVGTEKKVEGLGTGALVRMDGYVLTNWHVIAGHTGAVVFLKPATSAEVKDAAAFGAKVVFQDRTTDLALLKLVRTSQTTLPSIPVAELSAIQVAEDVHIIGHPHGELWSYSTGVISQIRNNYEWTYADGSRHQARVLQMQTAINPGNSGGPVLDDSGSMVGLVAMSAEGQNLDYAIAADVIQNFLRQGYAINSRGVPAATDTAADHSYLARLASGDQINKLVVGSSTIYWVSKAELPDAEVYIVDRIGAVVHGEHPNSAGGFSDWLAIDQAHTVTAKSDGRLPQYFSRQ